MTAHLLGSGTERSQGRLGGFRKFNYAPSLAEAVSILSGGGITPVGLTSQLAPESIQLAPGQWLDTSGNGKHAYIPDGFRLGAASRSGDLSSVLTWATSSTDPRYVTGVNASAVPANSAITLYAKASVSGTFDIGDGNSATYYASAVSIGTTWTPITLTNPVNDGTNRKIVFTPTSAYTGSVTISAQVQVLA